MRRFVISGRVQGVGFRAWTRHHARRLGVRGWTRNRADGTVEVVAAGSDEQLAALRALLARGPPHAAVRDVRQEDATEEALPAGFEVRR